MSVPFIDLKRFEPDFMDRWVAKARHITENTMFVGGPEVTGLEENLARDTGARHAVGCANGTDAIQLALRAVGVGPGDLVLIPDATFWATFEAVVNANARPVTVDIDLRDLQMDFDLFREAVDKYQPKAAILVHLYGWCSARIDDFRQLCADKNIPLIEDGAQCYGVKWQGRGIYEDALIATTSFYPAKVYGSCGDAGAVFTRDKELADKVRLYGNHGRTSHYEHGVVGWNSRMAGFDAGFLNLTMEYLHQRLESRRRTTAWWREKLRGINACFVEPPEGCEENGYLVATLVEPEKRPAVQAILKDHGIGFGNVYPSSMSRQPGAEGWLKDAVKGEKADWLGKAILNPPVYAYMTEAELEESFAAWKKALQAVGP